MDRDDRAAIEALFDKLSAVERQAGPRDAEAESFIRERLAALPGATYHMAQTIVVQEEALKQAQARIESLERMEEEAPSGGGLLGGLFGGSGTARPRGAVPRVGRSGAGAQAPRDVQQRGGGGFLAGAAQTAMGVAGGMLLGSAIGGMFGGGEAEAAEPAPDADSDVADAGGDAGGFDAGGDFGDF